MGAFKDLDLRIRQAEALLAELGIRLRLRAIVIEARYDRERTRALLEARGLGREHVRRSVETIYGHDDA